MTDISETLAPKSQQLDNIELADGPRTFTVDRVVVKPGAEQPLDVYFVEFPRPWRPGVNQRRALGFCWTNDSSTWAGRRVRLFRDPDVKFGNDKPGGTRISHLSHITKTMHAPVLLSQGRMGTYTVEPLVEDAAPAHPTPAELAEQLVAALADATTEPEVREWGNRAHARGLLDLQVNGETVKNHVTKRLAELTEDPTGGES